MASNRRLACNHRGHYSYPQWLNIPPRTVVLPSGTSRTVRPVFIPYARSSLISSFTEVGGIISRGPGLSFVEATAVTPEGRSSPEDTGLWSDAQIPAYETLTSFAHSQGQKIAIQLVHGGRKASGVAPWLSFSAVASDAHGGWASEVVGPSAVAHSEGGVVPKELTKEGIKEIVQAFADSARRAVEAGFDVIELHGAHGFLLHSFASPNSNFRTDEYGGSWENRVRIIVEIADAVRRQRHV